MARVEKTCAGRHAGIVRGCLHGKVCDMKTTIDALGRLVIPKELRRRAGTEPGMSLAVMWNDGQIEIELAATPVDLRREGRFVVAVPQTQGAKRTADTVEETRVVLREQRSSQARW